MCTGFQKDYDRGRSEHFYICQPLFQRGTIIETSCLFPKMTQPYIKDPVFKVKNFPLRGAKSLLPMIVYPFDTESTM